MSDLSIRELGERFSDAFGLSARPVCIRVRDSVPEGAAPVTSVDRCIAAAIILMAHDRTIPPLYIGEEERQGCCPGGQAYLGLAPQLAQTRYFVSTGSPEYRGGEAAYLKASPTLVERSFRALGRITFPGRYIVFETCEGILDDDGALAICCFGTAEQVRNLAALVHFDRDDPFSAVIGAWGPACATFVTYPAGIAERAPREAAFIGPHDPTFNARMQPDMMAFGIPVAVARRMAENIGRSFVAKRRGVAFPER